MYKVPIFNKTNFDTNDSVEGKTIEEKVKLLLENGESYGQTKPLIYQERKEGVNRAYDIRTDRFEVAIEATEKIAKSYQAKRDNRPSLKQDEETDKPSQYTDINNENS